MKTFEKYINERKPKSFANMIESVSWYTKMRKEFDEQYKEKIE